MQPKLDYIRQLVRERGWSGSELARHMGISRAEANRFLNGTRRGGKKLITGLIQAFPEVGLDALFFLPQTFPDGNKNASIGVNGECALAPSAYTALVDMKPVRHPNARQLACSMNEAAGVIEITNGRNITVLMVSPGAIEVRHTTKKHGNTGCSV